MPDPDHRPLGNLMGLARSINPKWFIVAGLAQAAWAQYQLRQHESRFSVSVYEDDDIYVDLAVWLLDQIPENRRRSITAQTNRRSRGAPSHVDMDDINTSRRVQREVQLFLLHDGSRSQYINIRGHQVRVSVEEGGKKGEGPTTLFQLTEPGRVYFEAKDAAGRDAVLAFIRQVAETRLERETEIGNRLYVSMNWGGFRRRTDLPPRVLDTVILPEGQVESIIKDLTFFLDAEDDYARLGLPWHHGYLFEGPPGTGKTSLARALATEFGLDMYYVSLSDLDSDANLLGMMAEIQPRSILLLEDVDAAHVAVSRDEEKQSASASGLLNALDGVGTPHGLITIMTTNRVEKLDEALLRAGRADRIEHIGFLVEEQYRRLVKAIIRKDPTDLPPIGDREVTSADVIGALTPFISTIDPDEAMVQAALKELLG